MNFYLLLPSGDYFLLPDGGKLIIGTGAEPTPPTPTPTPSGNGRRGGIPGDFATARSKPQTLDEASRESDARRKREEKDRLNAILADDAEVMQIIERLLEAIDKN